MEAKTVDYDYTKIPPLVANGRSGKQLDDIIAAPMSKLPPKRWWILMGICQIFLVIGGISLFNLLTYGIGVTGNNNPIYWGWFIVNFVFWIGIGHAGTLISAVLFIMRQWWRNAIARAAEAMTVFAVMTAMIFPLIHTGRPWLAHYLLPYPNERHLWVNFTSALEWDVWAVSTYGLVSATFWYVGLIPDFAIMRDRMVNNDMVSEIRKQAYRVLSLGWRFSNRHWQHYERAYLILAGVCTPLVFSVHTIVSFDFATSQVPGWHTTIFPPYFVAGAVFSGFGMVVTVMTIIRWVYKLEDIITLDVLEKVCKVLTTTGLMVGYAYGMEFFIAWYGQNPPEIFAFLNRAGGPNNAGYFTMICCNVLSPLIFVIYPKARRTIWMMFAISILVNIGMWFERYVIVMSSLSRDFLPSSWAVFNPTVWDYGLLIGSFGLFFTLVLLFTRLLPVVAMSEIKGIADGAQPSHDGGH